MGDALTAAGSAMGILVLMLLIFVGAYYASKLMGKQYSMQAATSSNIRVVDRLMLGRDRYLLIVEVGDKTLLLGVSPERIETLAELDPTLFSDISPIREDADFLSLLMKRIKKSGSDDYRE